MARLRGWAPRGQCCHAAIPHGHWKTVTFVGGFTLAGFIASILLDGPMDGEVFRAWREQMLAPLLKPSHIVIVDNLAAHKVDGIRQAIEACGAILLYLPPSIGSLIQDAGWDRRPAWDGQALFDGPSGACSGGSRGRSVSAARHYDVSASFAVKLAERVSRTGSAEPARQGRPPGGGKLAPYLTALLE